MVQYTVSPLLIDNHVYTWAGLSAADPDGQPVGYTESSDRTVQVTGTFGGGTVLIQGSLDKENWFTLKSADAASTLSFSSAGLKGILENVVWLRPIISGGDGTSSVQVLLAVRRK